MITKKICMIGSFSVGKTSLVEQYVHSIFSDQYLSTVGVKISKKIITVDDTAISLILWDMEGKDDYSEVNLAYLRGAMGFFVVADGMRRETLEDALALRKQASAISGDIPNLLLINKADLEESWEIRPDDIAHVKREGVQVLCTSAKTGQCVEEAFLTLTRAML